MGYHDKTVAPAYTAPNPTALFPSTTIISFTKSRFLRTRKPRSLEICAFLNKPECRKKEVDAKYIGFTIPDEFVVGFGLDYNERYRNLPYVGVLKKIGK